MAYDIGPRIGITGEREFNQQIKLLNSSLKSLNAEMRAVTAAYDKNDTSTAALTAKKNVLNKAIDNQKTKLGTLTSQYDKQKLKLDELERELTDATEKYGKNSAEANKAKIAYDKQAETLEKLNANIHLTTANLSDMEKELTKVNNAKLENLSRQLDSAGAAMESAGKKMMLLSAAIVAGAGFAAKAAIDFESAFAGVEKTVDASAAQLKELSHGIRQMALEIPSSTTEIAAVAEAAGQLGIATEDVLSFSRVMIDLGETTNLSADEAASALAKFANITRMSAADYARLGSVIVDLGNNLATTEADIVNMSTRLASTGTLIGLTEAQIMALSAALSSLGIESQAGGTALSKLLKQFEVMVATGSKKLENFAKIANMSATDFAAAWEKDPVEALTAFITGLGELNKTGGSAVAVLQELGLTEIRLSNAVLAMASSGDLLTRSLNIANQAWKENTALQTEAEKRYATTASQLQIAKNTLNEIGITMGSEFLPMVNRAVEGIKNLGEWFASLDEAGKENIIRILAIVAAMGPMVTITGKAVSALGAATKALHAYRAAAAAGATTTAALGAAISATPVGAIATAIALLGSVIVGSLITNALTATEAVDGLAASLEKSKVAAEEAAAALQEKKQSTLELVASLEELIGKEEKTAADNAVILSLVEKLNEAIPSLALKYDELSGSMSLTVETIRAMALAQAEAEEQTAIVDRMTELYREQEQIEAALIEANESLKASEEALAAEREKGIEQLGVYSSAHFEVGEAVVDAKTTIDELTEKQKENEEELKTLEEKYHSFIETADDLAGEGEQLIETTANLTASLDEQSESTINLVSVVEKAVNAFAEQSNQGRLSLSTILDLVDAGYAAALSINEETGAVTLNREAYIELTKAKIETQIADLELLQTDVQTKLINDGKAALDTAGNFAILAASKSLANDADYQSYKSISAQIAALNNLKANLNKTTAATESYAKRTSTAATRTSKATTKISDAFEKAVENISRELELGEIGQQEYWDKYSALMSKHLKKGSEEWETANHKLLIGQKKLNDALITESEKANKKIADRLQGIKDEYDDAIKGIQRNIDSMAERIADVKLVTEKDDVFDFVDVKDLQKGNAEIERLSENLSKLKEAGISDTLLAEIGKMETDAANAYSKYLLSLKDSGQWNAYMSEWERRQQLAIDTAKNFYQDELETLDEEFTSKLTEALSTLEDDTRTIGQDAAAGLAKGILAGKSTVANAMAQLAAIAIQTAKDELGIESPSKVFAEIGDFSAQGWGEGFTERMVKVSEQIRNTMPTNIDMAGNPTMRAVERGISALAPFISQGGGNYTINVMLPDGKALASVVFDPLRGIAKQKGVSLA